MIWLHFICIMVVWTKRKKNEEIVLWNGNENEKTPKRAKMKEKKMRNGRPIRGELRREWNP